MYLQSSDLKLIIIRASSLIEPGKFYAFKDIQHWRECERQYNLSFLPNKMVYVFYDGIPITKYSEEWMRIFVNKIDNDDYPDFHSD